jgi:hypothetical protein
MTIFALSNNVNLPILRKTWSLFTINPIFVPDSETGQYYYPINSMTVYIVTLSKNKAVSHYKYQMRDKQCMRNLTQSMLGK